MAALRVNEESIALDYVTVIDPFGRAQAMFRVDMCDLNVRTLKPKCWVCPAQILADDAPF